MDIISARLNRGATPKAPKKRRRPSGPRPETTGPGRGSKAPSRPATPRSGPKKVWSAEERERWATAHPELFKLDNWHGPVAVLTDLGVILGSAWIASVQQLLPGIAFYLLFVLPVVSTRMRALATILHEASHSALCASRSMGRWWATYGSSYLVLQTFTAYQRSHLRFHHGRFGVVGEDPDLDVHVMRGLYAVGSLRRFMVRYVLVPLLGVDHPGLIYELVRSRCANLAQRNERREALIMLTQFAGLLVAAGTMFGWRSVLLYWLIPLLYGFPLVNWYIEILEHFPLVITGKNSPLRHSRQRALGPVTRNLLGIHGEGNHWVHHEFPRMPYWHQRAAIRMLAEEYSDIREMVEEQGASKWRPFGATRQLVGAGREVIRSAN